MKALILNSGLGSRIGSLTSEHPKCMTPIDTKDTIVSRQLRLLNDEGIQEVVMTTGLFDDVLRSYCASLDLPMNIQFVQNPVFRDTNYIYSIYCARELLDDDIVLMHGDLVFSENVLSKTLHSSNSCMTVSSTTPLPEKDFKAVIENGKIKKVGIEFFDSAMAAQPLYKINRDDWSIWLDRISEFCENGNTKCYAENAFNEVSDECSIIPLDVRNELCAEIDNPDDLRKIARILKRNRERGERDER